MEWWWLSRDFASEVMLAQRIQEVRLRQKESKSQNEAFKWGEASATCVVLFTTWRFMVLINQV